MPRRFVCVRCGGALADDTPDWADKCRDCFIDFKREERANETQALLKRALEAENKVDIAKRLVTQLQSDLRAAQGQLRAAQGKVGVQATPVAGASGLDRATLERMRRLCHPDKHANSQAANEVTALINELLNR